MRFAQVGGHRDERVLQLRQLAVRRRRPRRRRQIAVGDPLHGGAQRRPMPRAIDVDRPERQQQDRADRDRDDREVAAEQRRQPRHRDAGRDADAEQPRTALDDRVAVEALDAVEPGRAPACAARRAAPSDSGSVDLPMYSSASRLRASTRLSASVSVTTDPSGSGMSLNSVCSRVRLRPSAEHADQRALRRRAPDTPARSVGWFDIRPVISSLTCGLPVRSTSATYGIASADSRSALRRHARCLSPTPVRSLTHDVEQQRLIAQHRLEQRIALRAVERHHRRMARQRRRHRIEAGQVLVEVGRRRSRPPTRPARAARPRARCATGSRTTTAASDERHSSAQVIATT